MIESNPDSASGPGTEEFRFPYIENEELDEMSIGLEEIDADNAATIDNLINNLGYSLETVIRWPKSLIRISRRHDGHVISTEEYRSKEEKELAEIAYRKYKNLMTTYIDVVKAAPPQALLTEFNLIGAHDTTAILVRGPIQIESA